MNVHSVVLCKPLDNYTFLIQGLTGKTSSRGPPGSMGVKGDRVGYSPSLSGRSARVMHVGLFISLFVCPHA